MNLRWQPLFFETGEKMKQEAELTGKRWDFSSRGYNDIIQKEFTEVGDVWVNIVKDNAPAAAGKALDVGMGPGFFTIILSALGWDVTGVDCSADMVAVAKENLLHRELKAQCFQMDSHALDFPDNTFDYIVARNATWLLYDPETAFREWLRVLKPGGRLMYLDANWPYLDDPEMTQKLDEAYQEYERENGKAFNTYTGDKDTNDKFKQLVAFAHIRRPQWDAENLPRIGYTNVCIKPRVNEQIYPDWKQKLYDAIDEFLITADKG